MARIRDLSLLRRAGNGDETAFGELAGRYADRLYGLACSLTGRQDDAEEIVQETFLAAFRQLRTFREEASVGTWLTAILVRQAARARRSRGRRRTVPISEVSGGPDDDAALEPVSNGSREGLRLDVVDVLERLSPQHREVVVLREFEGRSYDEIARALGVPRGTVESRLHRARERLRELLRDYLD
ncbi:MAG: sigma-70 family RNA polymerase sigma factor [Planctomycetes bacterium]|nr:sigma-70 family RNA polymerase sigma factor [Planctomycetota bacterium]